MILRGWAPVDSPLTHPIVHFPSRSASEVTDAYLQLVFEVLLPPLRSAIVTSWEPRDPEPLLTLIEAWEGALPAVAMGQLLEALVMPKIRTAVGSWEPRQETVPIHAWIHPWLPYLGSQLEDVSLNLFLAIRV